MDVIRKSDGREVYRKDGVADIRSVDIDGTTVEFGSAEQTVDPSPLFRGLPDEMCQCTHFGYVVKGTYRFRGKGGVVTFNAGDTFHVTPGHIPLPDAGAEWVMFTPTAEQKRTDEIVRANMAAV